MECKKEVGHQTDAFQKQEPGRSRRDRIERRRQTVARASQPVFASALGPIATKIEEEMEAFGVEHGAGTAERWKESAGGRELLYGGQGKCLDEEQVDGERDGARKRRHGDISTGIGTEPLYLLGEPASTGKSSTSEPSQIIGEERGQQPIGKPSQNIGEARGECQHEIGSWTGLEPSALASSHTVSERNGCVGEPTSSAQRRRDTNAGLEPPRLWTGDRVNGSNKPHLKRQNKHRRLERQKNQQNPRTD